MTQYLTIFATSLNGFTNEPTLLSSDDEFNKNAQINSYFDWYTAHNSFVAPFGIIIIFPKELQSNDLFYIEEIYKDSAAMYANSKEEYEAKNISLNDLREGLLRAHGYDDETIATIIAALYPIYDLQNLMKTALEDPFIKTYCGNSRELGGE